LGYFLARWCRQIAAGCLAAVVAACAGITIDPQTPPGAPPQARLLVVGEIAAPSEATARPARRFRRDLARALAEEAPIAEVTTRVPATLPADALMISGRFEQIDSGNEFVRLAIGLGAGGPTLAGRFELTDAAGTPLLRFTQAAHPGGGSGWSAHWAPFDPDAAMAEFAADTAEVVIAWLEGRAL
jgi:hypothetical protein